MQTEKFYFQVTVSSLRHVSTHFLKVKTLNRCSQGSFAARKDGLNISRFVYQCEAEWWLIRWRLQILLMSCASAKVNNMWYRFQEFVVSPTANSCNCRITRLEEKKRKVGRPWWLLFLSSTHSCTRHASRAWWFQLAAEAHRDAVK